MFIRMVVLGLILIATVADAAAAEIPKVVLFSPSGTVKGVRQVHARFSTPMVAFGDVRLPAPFQMDCPAGTARWADPRNWIFDFDADLNAGIRCRFTLRKGLADAAGLTLRGPREFSFDTGGPSVIESEPWNGNTIDEEQIFILGLDASATTKSIEQHARCRADGVNETIGVRVISGPERKSLLEANPNFLRRYARELFKHRPDQAMTPTSAEDDTVHERILELIEGADSPVVLVQCKQRLPNGARMALDWDAGIAAPSGLVTAAPQMLQFVVREAFGVTFRCERINKDAACIPALPMGLRFTSPI
ncbi:MAG: Ig-like domain-containing protein, partial [Gammaproteobacteria bacterium]